MENYIKEIMNELGMKRHVKGYRYLIEMVELHIKKPTWKMMDKYVVVASNNNSTASRVERALRHVSHNTERIQKYFDIDYKATNTVVVHLIAERAEEYKEILENRRKEK